MTRAQAEAELARQGHPDFVMARHVFPEPITVKQGETLAITYHADGSVTGSAVPVQRAPEPDMAKTRSKLCPLCVWSLVRRISLNGFRNPHVTITPSIAIGHECACWGYPACWWISFEWVVWRAQLAVHSRPCAHCFFSEANK